MSDIQYIDVALGKPAFQSSASRWSTPAGAAGCLQPEIHEPFGFHTGLEENPWWSVDFLCSYPIDKIIISNRSNKGFENAKTLKIEVSENSTEWTLIHEGLCFFGYKNGFDSFTLPLSGQISARYLRLSLKEKTYFHLKRVEVLVDPHKARKAEMSLENFPYLKRENSSDTNIEVSIIGTSNSIMKGYVQSLERCGITIKSNLSIGSSHSTLIPFRLEELKNPGDFTIFDFSPNEHIAINSGFNFFSITSDVLDNVKNWCIDHKTNPIGLIMPHEHAYINSLNLRLRKWQEDIFLKKGIPFFNGYDVSDQISQIFNRTSQSLFDNPAHLNVLYSRFLGSFLGLKLEELHQNPEFIRKNTETKNIKTIKHFKYEKISEKIEITNRKTNLLNMSFARLKPHDSIEFDIPKGHEVIGLVMNMPKTNGCLHIQGVNDVQKYLGNSYFNTPKSILAVVWSLLTPVLSGDEGIKITCISPNEEDQYEVNDHQLDGFHINKINPNEEIAVEIHGLMVRSPEKECRVMSYHPEDLHLSKNLDFSIFG